MSISYKYNDKRLSLFPLVYDNAKGNKFFMCPIWRPGKEKAVFPYQCKHVLQLSHANYNISAICRRAYPSGGSNQTMYPSGIRMRESNGYISDSYWANYNWAGLNPYYFRDMGCETSAKFCSTDGLRPRISHSAWPGNSANCPGGGEIWDHSDHVPARNACIYLGNYAHRTIAYHGEESAAYGFVIALNKKSYWSSSSVMMEMGQIFAVDKGNTAHSITMYYKGSTKGGLTYPNGTYYYAKDTHETRDGWYSTQRYQSGALRHVFRFYGKDSDISGFNVGGKTYRTSAYNWNQYHSRYYEGAETTQDKNAKNIKLIGEDSTYKYIIAKGRHRITSADTHIFTPPSILYSGNKSGVIEPLIIDAWVGFH